MDLHTTFLHPSIYIVVNTQLLAIKPNCYYYIEGNGLIQHHTEGNGFTEEKIRRQ